MQERVVLRYASGESGAPFAMTYGMRVMQRWSADSWDLQRVVSSYIVIIYLTKVALQIIKDVNNRVKRSLRLMEGMYCVHCFSN